MFLSNYCLEKDFIETGTVMLRHMVFKKTAVGQQMYIPTNEGFSVNGYFHWSLMDKFEGMFGYRFRFSLSYIDYKTLLRTLKLSTEYFRT